MQNLMQSVSEFNWFGWCEIKPGDFELDHWKIPDGVSIKPNIFKIEYTGT